MIPRLKEAGVTQVFIGFEKIEDQDLSGVNKQNSTENNEKALDILRNYGIGVVASFIIDPHFTRQDFKRMASYIKKANIQFPTFSVLTPLPGTELYEKYKEKIITRNWELFDLMHSVLPTRLPRKEFYRELARLYLASYCRPGYLIQGLSNLGRTIFQGGDSCRYASTLLKAAWHFINPNHYTRRLADETRID